MDERARELAWLRDNVVPEWSEGRSERLFAGVGQLRRRRRVQKLGASLGAVVAVACAVYLRQPAASTLAVNSERGLPASSQTLQAALATQPVQAKPVPVLRLAAKQQMQLADGSQIRVLSSDGDLAVLSNEPEQIAMQLTAGIAHFDVVPHRQQRSFVVASGGVEVIVVGTVFDVEHSQGWVRVAVREGKVRVRGASGVTAVQAGESAWFDEHGTWATSERADSAEPASDLAPPAKLRGHARHGRARDEAPRAAWRSLSQSGDYEGAYRLLAQGSAVADDSGALMDAADAARLSGHAEDSVVYLRKVLSVHRNSPVAPLAAFTLGRVLLERLGQPSEAADAFAMARKLAPQGSLAQDALAREVEAWSKAGHPDEAYARARDYVSAYPAGRRLRAVQLYGGL